MSWELDSVHSPNILNSIFFAENKIEIPVSTEKTNQVSQQVLESNKEGMLGLPNTGSGSEIDTSGVLQSLFDMRPSKQHTRNETTNIAEQSVSVSQQELNIHEDGMPAFSNIDSSVEEDQDRYLTLLMDTYQSDQCGDKGNELFHQTMISTPIEGMLPQVMRNRLEWTVTGANLLLENFPIGCVKITKGLYSSCTLAMIPSKNITTQEIPVTYNKSDGAPATNRLIYFAISLEQISFECDTIRITSIYDCDENKITQEFIHNSIETIGTIHHPKHHTVVQIPKNKKEIRIPHSVYVSKKNLQGITSGSHEVYGTISFEIAFYKKKELISSVRSPSMTPVTKEGKSQKRTSSTDSNQQTKKTRTNLDMTSSNSHTTAEFDLTRDAITDVSEQTIPVSQQELARNKEGMLGLPNTGSGSKIDTLGVLRSLFSLPPSNPHTTVGFGPTRDAMTAVSEQIVPVPQQELNSHEVNMTEFLNRDSSVGSDSRSFLDLLNDTKTLSYKEFRETFDQCEISKDDELFYQITTSSPVEEMQPPLKRNPFKWTVQVGNWTLENFPERCISIKQGRPAAQIACMPEENTEKPWVRVAHNKANGSPSDQRFIYFCFIKLHQYPFNCDMIRITSIYDCDESKMTQEFIHKSMQMIQTIHYPKHHTDVSIPKNAKEIDIQHSVYITKKNLQGITHGSQVAYGTISFEIAFYNEEALVCSVRTPSVTPVSRHTRR